MFLSQRCLPLLPQEKQRYRRKSVFAVPKVEFVIADLHFAVRKSRQTFRIVAAIADDYRILKEDKIDFYFLIGRIAMSDNVIRS